MIRAAGVPLVVSLSLLAPAALRAATPESTQEDAAAGPDARVQGEYVGYLERDGDPEPFGIQVVAQGKGTFEAVGFRGGLPGAGWDRSEKSRYSGKTDGDSTVLARTDGAASAAALVVKERDLEARDASGAKVGHLFRVVRKSPTLGRAAPAGAKVLFGGTTSDAFRAANEKPVPVTKDGCLQLLPGSGGLFSKEPHGSCTLHLEFRLPFEPTHRGQGRANSGCYLQSRFEVQILDSFGLEGLENECGGMYEISRPDLNMCLPPLTWQTYDVEFTEAKYDDGGKKVSNPRVTVRHNGVLVHPDREVTRADGQRYAAAPEPMGPGRRPLHLQDHGHEILFRNIWISDR